MLKIKITHSAQETREYGEAFSRKLQGGEIICLQGELGSGKTTFTQGLLQGLHVPSPYTSPTFVIMKSYPQKERQKFNVYHLDAYRVQAEDILALGWEEIIQSKNNIVVVEWAEKIKKIIPPQAYWLKFEGEAENKRKIIEL